MEGHEILIGVCGGIAAYKTADLTSKLMQAGASVSVVLTQAGEQFVGATTFEALTGRPVYRELFAPHEHFRGEHIALADRSKLLLVAPATANFLAKAAHGIADDLLSTLALSVTAPILLAPAMNTAMWNKPSVQRNVTQLRQDGVHIIEPGTGWLSCGHIGAGRMAEPGEILERVRQLLS